MSRSHARVRTDRPHRYAKQLASHLGRRATASWDEAAGKAILTFQSGTGTLTATPDALLLDIDAAPADLPGLEDVIGRHLVRFATQDKLTVAWQRDNGDPGLTFDSEDNPAS